MAGLRAGRVPSHRAVPCSPAAAIRVSGGSRKVKWRTPLYSDGRVAIASASGSSAASSTGSQRSQAMRRGNVSAQAAAHSSPTSVSSGRRTAR